VAQDAISAMAKSLEDLRPTIAVKVQGHIFDHSVLNRIMDLVVDSPCSFEVKQLNVGGKNEFLSTAGMCMVIDGSTLLPQSQSRG
jgi:homocitrate synthase